MSRFQKHQGVISGEFNFDGCEYVEIFDRQRKYIYGVIDDLFVAHGTWVEYTVVDAPRNHPKNCNFFAKDVTYVDGKSSNAPTSDEFRSNEMNVRDYNKVDFFQYDNSEGQLSHKSTITRDPSRGNQYYNSYYGDVIISSEAHRRLLEHRIDTLDVMLNLIPSKKYVSGPCWEVVHFINQGKCYSINGYLSITGHVLRGPGGVVRNRCEVTVAPDSLRPRDATLNAFGKTESLPPPGYVPHTTTFSDSTVTSLNTTSTSVQKNAFDKAFDDTIDKTSDLTLKPQPNPFQSTFNNGNRNGNGNRGGFGFGRSRNSGPIGLGRLSNAHF